MCYMSDSFDQENPFLVQDSFILRSQIYWKHPYVHIKECIHLMASLFPVFPGGCCPIFPWELRLSVGSSPVYQTIFIFDYGEQWKPLLVSLLSRFPISVSNFFTHCFFHSEGFFWRHLYERSGGSSERKVPEATVYLAGYKIKPVWLEWSELQGEKWEMQWRGFWRSEQMSGPQRGHPKC